MNRVMGSGSTSPHLSSLQSTLPLHHPLIHSPQGDLLPLMGCSAPSLVQPLTQEPLWGTRSPSSMGHLFQEANGRVRKTGWSMRRKWGETRGGGGRVWKWGLRRVDGKWGSEGVCVGPWVNENSTQADRKKWVSASLDLQRVTLAYGFRISLIYTFKVFILSKCFYF